MKGIKTMTIKEFIEKESNRENGLDNMLKNELNLLKKFKETRFENNQYYSIKWYMRGMISTCYIRGEITAEEYTAIMEDLDNY